MKENTTLLLDIIQNKKKHIEMFMDELNNSLDIMDENNLYIYKNELSKKQETIEFLDSLIIKIKDSPDLGLKILKNGFSIANSKHSIKINKEKILKELIKEYQIEYKKNYWNNKYIGISGIFDNDLFCNIIKNKINKYSNCNKVTKTKYKHLNAFLNELLNDMENAENPLKMLKQKMKLSKKYKKTEYIEIRKYQKAKIDIIKEILEEYKMQKNEIRCK